MCNFTNLLENRIRDTASVLCLGLDPRIEEIDAFCSSLVYNTLYIGFQQTNPEYRSDATFTRLLLYCRHLLSKTLDFVCCVKPNLAFFIAHGSQGIKVTLRPLHFIIGPRSSLQGAKGSAGTNYSGCQVWGCELHHALLSEIHPRNFTG
ncbi:bifunctional Aldolase-type TIM barrel/Ribulose-phosphate binding barrel [Babesia duncani]|uniref:Orotidine 5'-phosphate decarboxylase n=1 Tax=Babesia duncani TaxID=323732 RepID=A0AAD9PMN9_9APIC|nr:bifunctional Aldolase-type TIM barrel/Ribulose-phosphate binding barrel [Babesia duncani]